MWREAPEGPNLLATARDALLQEILPKLSGTDAFTARMIANAMAIAAREAVQGDAWVEETRATMQRLTGAADASDRALAAAIRAGAYDPGSAHHAEVVALLREATRMRCAISAPRVLGKG
ncbi:MAG: hypothetical protein INF79_03250 [Roseomonas sp.]|nr:hypothetical protein [Roseomonas sp.]MCA3328316.1 hypothetical protein [Roseomonas sp.]MCA3331480.1 hypothetical protein [Roseomonas sp.]MCA3335559.1 hypothetical protein [Roseomonas sp.]MCA3347453.1 hypothetical protein [Roseomonas sp.]